jgi:hypothetical protein
MAKVRLPPTFKQICVVAAEQIQANPTIDDAEWKARIKDRLLALGFAYPESQEAIPRVMSAVQQALEKQWGPRQAPFTPATTPDQALEPRPLSHAEASRILTRILTGAEPSPPLENASSPCPRCHAVHASKLTSLAEILCGTPTPCTRNQTSEQVRAWQEHEETREPQVKTARGWVRRRRTE